MEETTQKPSIPESYSSLGELLHEYIFMGGIRIGESWGGPKCHSHVSFEHHMWECLIWSLILLILYKLLRVEKSLSEFRRKALEVIAQHDDHHRRLRNSSNSGKISWSSLAYIAEGFLDRLLFLLTAASWSLILYYKINLHSLINMLQPCHVTLFLHAVALSSKGSTGVMIGVLLLPMTLGSAGALAFPDTSGLDQPFERENFWLSHYLIQFTPLYLLVRKNFAAYKLAHLSTLSIGNWIFVACHWWVLEPINLTFSVNLNFLLCPGAAMEAAFTAVPAALLYPSYRNLCCGGFVLLSTVLSYIYILFAGIIFFIVSMIMIPTIDHREALERRDSYEATDTNVVDSDLAQKMKAS